MTLFGFIGNDVWLWLSCLIGGSGLACLIFLAPRSPQSALRKVGYALVSPTGDRSVEVVLEVAMTAREQRVGLMFRSAVPDKTGMLFRWGRSTRSAIWMKNVQVPLDLVFLDENNRVCRIVTRSPRGYKLTGLNFRSDSLIELQGGFCKKYGVKPGWSSESVAKGKERMVAKLNSGTVQSDIVSRQVSDAGGFVPEV